MFRNLIRIIIYFDITSNKSTVMQLKLILNYRLGEVEKVKLNLESKINELYIESKCVGLVDITKIKLELCFVSLKSLF